MNYEYTFMGLIFSLLGQFHICVSNFQQPSVPPSDMEVFQSFGWGTPYHYI